MFANNAVLLQYGFADYTEFGNEADIDVIRRDLYTAEKQGYRAGEALKYSLGEKFFRSYLRTDFPTYREHRSIQSRSAGSRSKAALRNYNFKQNGSGNDQENRGAGLSCSSKALSPAGFCALFIFANGAVLLQYGFADYTEFGNEADIDVIRRDLYTAEKQGYRAGEALKYSLGEKFFRSYLRTDFPTYREHRSIQSRSAGSRSKAALRNYNFKQNGSGNDQENRGAGLSCSSKAHPPPVNACFCPIAVSVNLAQ